MPKADENVLLINLRLDSVWIFNMIFSHVQGTCYVLHHCIDSTGTLLIYFAWEISDFLIPGIDQCYMHIIVSHWNSYIIALTFYFLFFTIQKLCQKIEESTTYENIITLSKDCSFRGLVIIIFYTMNNQALCYRIKIPVGNFQRENCPSWWRIIIYILQVGITDFSPLIGKTVSFELYIGDIGGGHL